MKHVLSQHLTPASQRDPKSLEAHVEEITERLDDAFYNVLSTYVDGIGLSERGEAVLEAEATGLTVRIFLEIGTPSQLSKAETEKLVSYAQRAIGYANITL